MNCPVCDGRMRAVEKHGVEVDICPDCKGVWLDRGELDKIIEMVEGGQPRPRADRPEDRPVERPREEERRREDYDRERPRERGYDHDTRTGRPKKRGSFLSEIFDSFGGGDD